MMFDDSLRDHSAESGQKQKNLLFVGCEYHQHMYKGVYERNKCIIISQDQALQMCKDLFDGKASCWIKAHHPI